VDLQTPLGYPVFKVLSILCFLLAALPGAHAEPFKTIAPVVYLLDVGTGMVLLSKEPDRPVEPAAMAKMMTVFVVAGALASDETSLERDYPVSEDAWRRGGAPSGSATMFAALRSRIRVADLLRGAMVQAANDACLILAEGIAGSEAAFVERSNKLAQSLGLSNTRFTNVTGFADPKQTTTARDLARLGLALIDTYPQIYAIYSEKEFTWNKIRQLNRNPLLAQNEGADGITTGSSDNAGFGLVASAVRNGRRLMLVLHGLASAKERADEAKRLLDWGFGSFALREAFAAGEPVGEVEVFGGASWRVPVAASAPVKILVRTDAKDGLAARIVYDGPIPAPIRSGDAMGRLQILREGASALEVPLRAVADVPVGSLPKRALGSMYEMAIGLVRGGEAATR
jgi:D-alanyl-D-alanine carboxypeptidase (penicillin-binding protein 5/6)